MFLFQAIQFNQTIQFSISMPLVLFNPKIGPYLVLPRRARVDLGAMAMNGCSVFPKALHYWDLTIRLFNVISWGGLTPLQRCSQCILQPQPTGQATPWKLPLIN